MHRNKIKLGKFSMVSKPFILILKCVCMTMSTEPGWAVTDCRMTCYRLLDDLLQTDGWENSFPEMLPETPGTCLRGWNCIGPDQEVHLWTDRSFGIFMNPLFKLHLCPVTFNKNINHVLILKYRFIASQYHGPGLHRKVENSLNCYN